MKKTIITTLIAIAGIMPASAQTEFRHITFDEAKTAAKAEGKLIFVDFYTKWCGPCKRMVTTIFPKKEIGDYLNSNYICIKLDAEAEGKDLANTVNIKAYPTFIVFDANGKALGSFAGMKDGQEFITAVEICKNPELSLERVKQRYEAGERNAEVVGAYAVNIVNSSRKYSEGVAKAGEILDKYFAGLTDAQRLMPENYFIYASYPTGYNSPRIQFAIKNRNLLDASKAESTAELLRNQHDREVQRYFCNNAVTDEATRQQFENFKKNADELGYTSKYANKLRFAEARISMSTDAYIDYCEKNFATIDENERGLILGALSNLFTPSTSEQVKKVTAFARKHIGTLPSNYLIRAAFAINDLESPKKH